MEQIHNLVRKKINCCTFFASDLLIVRTNARKFDFTRYLLLNGMDSIKLATEIRDCWESDPLHRDICQNWPESNIVSNLKNFLDEEFQFSIKYESNRLLKQAFLIMASCLPNITDHFPLRQKLRDICRMKIRKDIGLLSCLFGSLKKNNTRISCAIFIFWRRIGLPFRCFKIKKKLPMKN